MHQHFNAALKPWYLKQIHLFSGLTEAELEELERLTRMSEVKKGEAIWLSGDPGNTVYLLKKGRVKTVINGSSGKEITFEVLEPGEIFGELDMPDDSPRGTRAEALEDSLICAMRREDFERYLVRHPHLIVSLVKLIGLRFKKLQERVEDLAHRNVQARLAHLLLELSQIEGIPDGPDIRIRTKLTHQEMADVIGCTRETVTNSLGLLRRQGLISIDHRSITILNIERLSRLVL